MAFDPERYHRRSVRLAGYDYARAGAYFVTICTQERACLFGAAVDRHVRLSDAGNLVVAEREMLPGRFPGGRRACVQPPSHLSISRHPDLHIADTQTYD